MISEDEIELYSELCKSVLAVYIFLNYTSSNNYKLIMKFLNLMNNIILFLIIYYKTYLNFNCKI